MPHQSMFSVAVSALFVPCFIAAIASLAYHREIAYEIRRVWRKYLSAPLLAGSRDKANR